MNLWVCDVADDPGSSLDCARPITTDRARGVNLFAWTYDGVHLIYMQDNGGDKNTHLFAVPAAGGEARDLTPFPGARATVHADRRSCARSLEQRETPAAPSANGRHILAILGAVALAEVVIAACGMGKDLLVNVFDAASQMAFCPWRGSSTAVSR